MTIVNVGIWIDDGRHDKRRPDLLFIISKQGRKAQADIWGSIEVSKISEYILVLVSKCSGDGMGLLVAGHLRQLGEDAKQGAITGRGCSVLWQGR